MQIKALRKVKRFKIIGRIGLGITVPVLDKKTGQQVIRDGEPVTMPQSTDHFVVPPEVAEVLGDSTPKAMRIHFERDSLDDVFPTGLMQFRSNGDLICMGDGERVSFRRHIAPDHSTETVIYERVARWDRIEELGLLEEKKWADEKNGYGTTERIGTNAIRCLYMDCPRYKALLCKPTGKLRFCIENITRQGYYQMTVHFNPMREIITQLDDGRQRIRNHTGRATIVSPAKWLLKLTGPTEQWMNVRKSGQIEKRQIKNIYTPELELDPLWLEDLEAGRVEFPQMETLTDTDVWGPQEEELDKSLLDPEPFVESSNDEEDEVPF